MRWPPSAPPRPAARPRASRHTSPGLPARCRPPPRWRSRSARSRARRRRGRPPLRSPPRREVHRWVSSRSWIRAPVRPGSPRRPARFPVQWRQFGLHRPSRRGPGVGWDPARLRYRSRRSERRWPARRCRRGSTAHRRLWGLRRRQSIAHRRPWRLPWGRSTANRRPWSQRCRRGSTARRRPWWLSRRRWFAHRWLWQASRRGSTARRRPWSQRCRRGSTARRRPWWLSRRRRFAHRWLWRASRRGSSAHRRPWCLRRHRPFARRRPCRCWSLVNRRPEVGGRRADRQAWAVPAQTTAPRRSRLPGTGGRARRVGIDRLAVQWRSAPDTSSSRHDRPAARASARAILPGIVVRNRTRRGKATRRITVTRMILHRTKLNGGVGTGRSPKPRTARDSPGRRVPGRAAGRWRRVRQRRYPSPAPGSMHGEEGSLRCTISSSNSSSTFV